MNRIVGAALAAAAVPCIGSATEPAYHDPGMGRIAQVAIVCRDVEASAARWAAFLGVPVPKVILSKPGRETNMIYKGQPTDARVRLAFFQAGPLQIELLEPVGGPSAWKDGLDANGEGVHHLGFVVQDFDRSVKALEAMGWAPLHSGRYDSDDGSYAYLDSRKDLGVIVEVLHSDSSKK